MPESAVPVALGTYFESGYGAGGCQISRSAGCELPDDTVEEDLLHAGGFVLGEYPMGPAPLVLVVLGRFIYAVVVVVGAGVPVGVFVAPNPWKANIMETFHGATTAKGYIVRLYNVKLDDDIKVFNVSGNLVYEGNASSAGSYDWNLVSRTRNQVSTGIYYWKVGDQSGKLSVIR